MNFAEIKSIVPNLEINHLLVDLVGGIQHIFGNDIVGVYLFGSLTYDAFNPQSSDVDVVTILKRPVLPAEMGRIKLLHQQIETQYPQWEKRIEASYTPIALFTNTQPPEEPRPYYGEGVFYEAAAYGNEWIINNQLLYKHGIALLGPPFAAVVAPIESQKVQIACIKDLFQEWAPKLQQPEWLNNSHYQSYLVLNLCRIFFTVMTAELGSKIISANWVKKQYPMWDKLIAAAENWHYGIDMHQQADVLRFLKWVIAKVQDTDLYRSNFK